MWSKELSATLSDLSEWEMPNTSLHLLPEAGFPLSIHKHTVDQIESGLAHWPVVGLLTSSWFDDAY